MAGIAGDAHNGRAGGMTGMILAAGFGTRLAPATDLLPKALVPAAGRPMIDHAIDALLAAGCTRIVINAHHHARQIDAHVRAHPASDRCTVIHEAEILGTGGGILHARALLDTGAPFLVHNADIVTDADLRSLAAACVPGTLAALLVSTRQTSRALVFDHSMQLLGKEAWKEEGEIYPDDAVRRAFCGVHVISPGFFTLIASEGFSDVFDLYRIGLRSGARITGVTHDGAWWDLGSLDKITAFERERNGA